MSDEPCESCSQHETVAMMEAAAKQGQSLLRLQTRLRKKAEAELAKYRAALDGAASCVTNAADIYRHLVMDTPEDQTLHARVIASLDNAAAALAALTNPDGS